jgi:hypothetical protein
MTILVIGDSFSAPTSGLTMWPDLIGSALSIPVINQAYAGTGYVNPGADTPRPFNRQLHWQRGMTPSAVQIIIMFGSVNDRGYVTSGNADRLYDSTLITHLELQRLYPTTKQLIVGPQWAGPQAVPAELNTVRDAVLAAMWNYDWLNPMVDPIADNWFPSNRLDLLGPDQFHPNQSGQALIQSKLQPVVRSILGI